MAVLHHRFVSLLSFLRIEQYPGSDGSIPLCDPVSTLRVCKSVGFCGGL